MYTVYIYNIQWKYAFTNCIRKRTLDQTMSNIYRFYERQRLIIGSDSSRQRMQNSF